MLHTLEMVVRMQTGEVTSGLDIIENKIVNLVDQISNFKPAVIFSDSQVQAVAAISDAMKTTDRFTGLVNDRNLESYLTNLNDLEVAVEKGNILREQGQQIDGLVEAQRRHGRITERVEGYYDSIDSLITNNAKILDKIVNSKMSIINISKKELKDIKAIASSYDSMQKAGVDIEKNLGITVDHIEKVQKFAEEADDSFLSWEESLSSINRGFKEIVPDIAEFGKLLAPVALLGKELDRLNKIYEDNHTVNNIFVADMERGKTVTEAFATIQQNATKNGVLLAESQRSLNAVLQSGQVYFENNGAALEEYANEVARTARATGISEKTLADLSLRSDQFGKSIGRTTKLTDAFVNIMAENRLTTDQMHKITGVLHKDLSRLDSQYKIMDKSGKMVAGGAETIATMMGEIGAEARNAGRSTDAAMDLMTRAIQDPLSVAPLLQGALTSNSIGEQFLAMGENADVFLKQMNSMPKALQATFAQKLGTTPEELVSMADGSKKLREEIARLTPEMGEEAARAKVIADITRERTDADLAAKNAAEAQANAARQLQLAMDQLRIIFGKVAVALQPVLTFMADMLSVTVESDLAKWTLVAAGAFLALVGPLKILSSISGGITGIFSKLSSSIGGLAGQKTGGLKAFGDGLAGFIKTLSSIKPMGALQAALVVLLVGAALAGGVALLGLAANLLPPDKTAQLAITVGGILGVMLIVALMAPVGEFALLGAALVLLVGVALAAGVALLGWVSNKFPVKDAKGLMVTVGILLATMLALALLAPVAPVALIGAAALLGVSGLLAAAIYALSSVAGGLDSFAAGIEKISNSLSGLTPEMGSNLKDIGVGLTAFAAALAGGALIELFSSGVVDQATKLAQAMIIMRDPIVSIASIGGEAAGAFKMIGEGLAMMSSALVGGGLMSFFTGDTVKNAQGLATAMGLIAGPITSIGAIGAETALVFNRMAYGLKQFVNVLKEDAGWFSSFEENAEDIAAALSKIAAPMKEIIGVQQGNIESSLKNAAKVQAEEIRSALALTINSSSENDDEIISKLEAIRLAIEEHGGVVGGTSPELIDEIKKSTNVLESIFNEMSMGGSFGNTSADTGYIT